MKRGKAEEILKTSVHENLGDSPCYSEGARWKWVKSFEDCSNATSSRQPSEETRSRIWSKRNRTWGGSCWRLWEGTSGVQLFRIKGTATKAREANINGEGNAFSRSFSPGNWCPMVEIKKRACFYTRAGLLKFSKKLKAFTVPYKWN